MDTTKIEYFKKKQEEIMAAHNAFEPERQKLIAEHQAKADALKSEYVKKIDDAAKSLEDMKDAYKKELKDWCGVTDGERASILDVVGLVLRMSKHD
jgi:hypothetical protein